jgi:SAM-dependent methyltransferase
VYYSVLARSSFVTGDCYFFLCDRYVYSIKVLYFPEEKNLNEVRSGIRHTLARPWVYDTFQRLVGAYSWRKNAIQKFVASSIPQTGKLIDIGCGTAEVLSYLPNGVEYIGFDRNPDYILKAKEKYSHLNATFYCEELSLDFPFSGFPADVVLALGLVHHLDDTQTLDLLRLAKKILSPTGILLTLDPVFEPEQSMLARYIISKDRGTAVRKEMAYKELALQVFPNVKVNIDKNPLRIPYTGIVMVCSAEEEAEH